MQASKAKAGQPKSHRLKRPVDERLKTGRRLFGVVGVGAEPGFELLESVADQAQAAGRGGALFEFEAMDAAAGAAGIHDDLVNEVGVGRTGI